MAEDQKAAVYVSFQTFKNALDSLAQGIPNQVDRSTFSGLSGSVQSQLLAGMKFLGLITDDDKPTATLNALAVTDESKRKEKLKEIVQERYAALFALDLMKTTPQQLSNTMGEQYGVSGDTKEKAIRFFLSALQYVDIQVSRFIKIPGAASAGSAPKTKRKSSVRKTTEEYGAEDEVHAKPASGTSRVIQLSSGGALTLAASIDLFALSPSDREFVFGLIDKLDTYEKGKAQDLV